MASAPTNSNQRAAIEQIVRQVLAELRATANTAPRAAISQAHGMPSVGASSSTLTLTTKVVTAAALEGRLSAGTQLVVPRGAIFTPAARDELKKFNVTVASAVGRGGPASKQRLRLATYAKYDIAPLVAGLVADNLDVECSTAAELPAIVADLTQKLPNARGLLITDSAAAAVALANRQASARAALVCSAVEIDRAAGSLSPNLLVIDPVGRSVFELRQLVRHWLRHPEPSCPAALAPYLN